MRVQYNNMNEFWNTNTSFILGSIAREAISIGISIGTQNAIRCQFRVHTVHLVRGGASTIGGGGLVLIAETPTDR